MPPVVERVPAMRDVPPAVMDVRVVPVVDVNRPVAVEPLVRVVAALQRPGQLRPGRRRHLVALVRMPVVSGETPHMGNVMQPPQMVQAVAFAAAMRAVQVLQMAVDVVGPVVWAPPMGVVVAVMPRRTGDVVARQ